MANLLDCVHQNASKCISIKMLFVRERVKLFVLAVAADASVIQLAAAMRTPSAGCERLRRSGSVFVTHRAPDTVAAAEEKDGLGTRLQDMVGGKLPDKV